MKGRREISMLVAAVAFLLGMAGQSWAIPCEWTIDKSADQTELTLSLGQVITVNYTLTATQNGCCANTGAETCVDITDPMGFATPQRVVAVGNEWCAAVPHELTYSVPTGPYRVCGDYTIDNTATLQGICYGDWSGQASWTVRVNVPCDAGCTLTQGYWKTHSELGPAPYDDTWALLPQGAGTLFFHTKKSWYQVLRTPPKGNAYYILAHQYIAAYLNELNGADTSALGTALTSAAALLDQYDTYDADAIPKPVRKDLKELASIFDQYNNGEIGPGHCSEEVAPQ